MRTKKKVTSRVSTDPGTKIRRVIHKGLNETRPEAIKRVRQAVSKDGFRGVLMLSKKRMSAEEILASFAPQERRLFEELVLRVLVAEIIRDSQGRAAEARKYFNAAIRKLQEMFPGQYDFLE